MSSLVDDVSKRLKIARKANGFKTAKEFSEKYSIPTSTYNQHEGGKRTLSIENLINYAYMLNIDPTWLLTGQGNPCENEVFSDIEQKILEEQDNLGKSGELDLSAIPIISSNKTYCNINVVLLM